LIHGAFGFGDDFGGDFGDVAFADFGGEVSFVGGAEDGAAEFEDADGVFGFEDGVVAGWEEAFEAVAEADDFPAELVCGADDAVDDGVEAGAVAAGVEDADAHGGGGVGLHGADVAGFLPAGRGRGLLDFGEGKELAAAVFDGCAGGEPGVVDGPALADEGAGAVEAVWAVEDDDDEAAGGGSFGAVGFVADEGLAVHAGGEALAGEGGGAGFDAEDADFADEFVGVADGEGFLAGGGNDADLAGFLADDEVEGVSPHGVDGEAGDVCGGGVALGAACVVEAVGVDEAGVGHADGFGEFAHFGDEGGDGVGVFPAAAVDVAADVVGEGEGGEVVGAEERGVEGVAEGHLVSGLEVEGVWPADEGDGLGDDEGGGGDVGAGGGGPVDDDGGGGDFGEAGDGAFDGGVGGDEDFAGVGLDDHDAFGCLGVEGERKEEAGQEGEREFERGDHRRGQASGRWRQLNLKGWGLLGWLMGGRFFL